METNQRINSENGNGNNREVAAGEITEHETETQNKNNGNGKSKPIPKPNFNPEQQEWFNRVFIPNLRSGVTKSMNGNNDFLNGILYGQAENIAHPPETDLITYFIFTSLPDRADS